MCFFFKQKTEDEMRISDWSSDVCSSDLTIPARFEPIKLATGCENVVSEDGDVAQRPCEQRGDDLFREPRRAVLPDMPVARDAGGRLSGPGLECKASASEVVTIVIEIGDHFEEVADDDGSPRSDEHTSELQSLLRISYA